MLTSPTLSPLTSWSLRLLLAAALAFGSEILIWTNPPGRTLADVLLLIPGYLILGAMLLDFIVRYRTRDLFGVLVLAGFYSLAAALALNPASTLNELPRTLVTRVMGAHALLAAEMIGLLLALTGGAAPRRRRTLLIGSVFVGLAWGMWVRWWPADAGLPDVPLLTMLLYGAGGVALLAGLLIMARRSTRDLTPDALRLSVRGWVVIVVVLSALIIVRLLNRELTPDALLLVALLLALSWAILWFRGRTKGRTLLDGCVPVQTPTLVTLLSALAIFTGVAIFAYNLPRIQLGEVYQLTLITLGFTAYGLAWLPSVSLILGAQAYIRQIQTRKM